MDVRSILASKGTQVATVQREATLADAAALLRDHGVGALVVSGDSSRIDGIISERDVVRSVASHGAGALGRSVASAMTTDVVTCAAEDSVDQLMALMTAKRIRHVPVVGADGLAGIISIGDVVKARVGHLESENQTLFDYINAR